MKKGFTLAEVLITLMIIGIVAALTIPSVISNYQQQEFKTGLKKAVSVLNEAIQTNIAQDGETPLENQDLFRYLQRHMSVIKSVPRVAYCHDSDNFNKLGESESTICGGAFGGKMVANKIFYTTDGMRFEIPETKTSDVQNKVLHESGVNLSSFYNPYSGLCGSYGLGVNSSNTNYPPCIISVDVNGDKKPNALIITANKFNDNYYPNSKNLITFPAPTDKKLQDVFTIMITDEKAIPFGVVAQRAMYSK